MKLYYATGTCALAPHIVALEAGIPLELDRVDVRRTPHVTEAGEDYRLVNPNNYVPALRLDDGTILTEGVVIVQYLADLKPDTGLAPAAGTAERTRLQIWLIFIATELHKMYSPWLFHPEYGDEVKIIARRKILERLAFVDKELSGGGKFLMGPRFTAADAYLFTIVGWSSFVKLGLSGFTRLTAYMRRVGERPNVREAMRAEGMKVAA
ncbi:MAG: glutathione transferase GstA [Steroidobacteraceae bacterium]